MSTILPRILSLFTAVLLPWPALAADRWAPNAAAGPVNQRVLSGNACGPAALLAAFQNGGGTWQRVPETIPGTGDKAKLTYIIRAHGLLPSVSLKDRKRWTGAGINAEDLKAVASELAATARLPAPRSEDLFIAPRESPEMLVRRCHQRLRTSLAKGLPPILSLRRFVFRNGSWLAVEGHFVTVVRVPEKLPRGAESFTFTCFDPWGGRKLEGTMSLPDKPLLNRGDGSITCLEAKVPGVQIGLSKVRPGERSAVVPAVIIGRW